MTVAIIGISNQAQQVRQLFSLSDEGKTVLKGAANINAYLAAAPNVIVTKASKPLTGVANMNFGNKPVDGGHLLLSPDEAVALNLDSEQRARFIRRIYGSAEFIQCKERYCLWIEDQYLDEAMKIEAIRQRVEGVRSMRLASRDKSANEMAQRSHQMREMNIGQAQTVAMPCVSSENRDYLSVGLLNLFRNR